MANPATNPGIQTSVNNTPQAVDDLGVGQEGASVVIDVMANDKGGNGKSLYSVNQTAPTTASLTATTALGGTVQINGDKILYTASGHAIDGLAQGETAVDTFNYAIQLGNGTISVAKVSVTITGGNDAPVITSGPAAATGAVTEAGNLDDGTIVAGVAAATGTLTSSDVDHGATAAWSGSANGTYGAFAITSAGAWTYSLDNARAATQGLAEGETKTETFTATVTDDHGATATQVVTVTVTGTNDSPLVTSNAAAATGAVVEAGLSTAGVAAAAGALTSSDVDHGATATWSGSANGTYGTFAIAADGTWSYSLDNARAATQGLAIGETQTDSFTATVTDDKGAVARQTVSVTVAGSNDGPVLAPDAVSIHALSEAAGQTGSSSAQSTTATLAFTDVDLSDHHTVTVGAPTLFWDTPGKPPEISDATPYAPSTLPGVLASALTAAVSESAGVGAVTANFTVADKTFDFLGANDTLKITYQVTVSDGHGGTSTQPVTILVSGAEDPVALGADPTPVHVLNESGNSLSPARVSFDTFLTLNDADYSDTHTATVSGLAAVWSGGPNLPQGARFPFSGLPGAPGGLYVSANEDFGVGVVEAHFETSEQAFDFVGQGETLTLTYTVTDTDGHGSSASRPVVVLINGANDAPFFPIATAGASLVEQPGVTGSSGADTANATVVFGDFDRTDTHTVSVGGTPTLVLSGGGFVPPATAGMLANAVTATIAAEPDPTAPGAATGSVNVGFSLPDQALDFLAQNQTLTATYTLNLADNHGGTVSRPVVFTITGANDAPAVTSSAAAASGAVTEAGATGPGVSAAAGQLTSADPDRGATATWSGSANGTYGTFAMAADGTWSYSLDNARAATQGLAAGETQTDSFTTTVTDDKGATATQAVTVTVNGSNDGPVLAADPTATHALGEAAGQTGSNAAQTAVASLAFTDVDLSDHHTVTVGAPTLFWDTPGKPPEIPDATPYAPSTLPAALASALTASVTEAAGAGSVTANFSVPDKTFDFLGANDTLKITYQVTVDDGHGGTSTQPVTILVSGADDPVVLGADPATHVFTELPNVSGATAPDGSPAMFGFNGALPLSDADYSDEHTVTVSAPTVVWSGGSGPPLPGLVSYLTGKLQATSNDDFGQGVVETNFQAEDRRFDFLAAGETATITYNLTVDDGHGSTASQPVTIVVKGSNDFPSIAQDTGLHQLNETAGQTGSLAIDSVSATLNFNDADRTDTHVISVSGPPALTLVGGGSVPGASATALANAVSVVWSEPTVGAPGSFTATLNAPDKTFDFLAAGQTLKAAYTVNVNDGHGGTLNRVVTFTVVGANDGPAITSDATAAQGSVQESGLGVPGVLTATGHLTSADPDQGATAAWSLNTNTGAFGSMAIDATTGQWTYTLNDGAADKLGAGETRTESFTAKVTDDKGAVANQTLTVTVNGANDAPVLAAGPNLSGALSFYGAEGNTVDTISGNNGVSHGVTYAAGHDGQAFNFTGSNYATIANQIPRDFTLSGWFKTSATAPGTDQFFQGNGLVYADVGGVNPDFGVSIVGNHLAFGSGGGGTDRTILSTSVVTTGDWVNFAVTRAGSVISLYINGTLENSYDTGYLGLLNAPSQIILGANTIDSRYYVGELDDVSVYNRALTATEIQQHSVLGSASMVEASGVSNSTAAVTGSVSLTLTDVDLPDTHTGVIAGPPTITVSGGGAAPAATVSALGGAASVAHLTDTTGTGVGSVSVAFSAQDKAFDFLAAGQTLSATYDVAVSDNHGGTAHQAATFTVTGTNDAPVLAADTGASTIGLAPPGFTYDAANGHAYKVVATLASHDAAASAAVNTGGYLATITNAAEDAFVGALINASGVGAAYIDGTDQGSFPNFHYQSGPEAGQAFAYTNWRAGEPNNAGGSEFYVYEQFDGTMVDYNKSDIGSVVEIETVTTFSAHQINELAATTGSNTPDTATATLNFGDLDLSDTHTVLVSAPTVTAEGGASLPGGLAATLAGALSASLTDSIGTGAGSVALHFASADKNFDFLKVGQGVLVSYNVTLVDGLGASSTQAVNFYVAGADDFQNVQLLANNSFEGGSINSNTIPGWTNGNGLSLEIVGAGFYGVQGDGHWLDTQATPGGITISQTVDVPTGQHATLSFSVAKELNSSLGLHPNSTLSFTWDGVVVKTVTEADFANWNTLQTFSVDVVGQSGGDTLSIHDDGTGQVGYALDWVRVDELVVV